GQVVPPGHTPAIVEYSHRALGGVTGLLILTTVFIWTRRHRFAPRVVAAGVGLLLLLAAQVGLGAAVVNLELPPMLVLVHLGMAMLLFAFLIGIAASATPRPAPSRETASPRFVRLVL